MYFTTIALALISALGAFAQNANPFNVPTGGYHFNAGEKVNLSWQPTTQGTVSLRLRSGNSGNLTPGRSIAAQISNTGSFTWNVPANIAAGGDYAIEISSDNDRAQTNFSPAITIQSSNSGAVSQGSVMSPSPSATPASSRTARRSRTGTSSSSDTASSTDMTSTMTPSPSPTSSSDMTPSPSPTSSTDMTPSAATPSPVATSTNIAAPLAVSKRVGGALAGLVAVGMGAAVVL